MANTADTLKASPLFKGLDAEHISSVLACLDASVKHYAKNEYILYMHDPIPGIGVVVSGVVQISKEDAFGTRVILTNIGKGQMFAESLICAQLPHSPVYAQALEPCSVMWVRLQKMLGMCQNTCAFHKQLIANMIEIVARKNLQLNEKIDVLSQKTIRQRVVTYLHTQANKKGKTSFKIPFSRTELADFLCVDRSALSRELSKMQDEGILQYKKNYFTLALPAQR